MNMQQLDLGVVVHLDASIGDFVGESWTAVIDAVRQMHAGLLDKCYIYGVRGTGKTHLLNAVCSSFEDMGKSALKLTLKDLVGLPTDTLFALENYDVIALDDMQEVAGHTAWQEAVFHLLNRCAEGDCQLLFSSNVPLALIPLEFKDLRSRLSVAPSFQLPDTVLLEERATVLANMIQRKNLYLDRRIVQYFELHGPAKVGQMMLALGEIEVLFAGFRGKRAPQVLLEGAKAIIDAKKDDVSG